MAKTQAKAKAKRISPTVIPPVAASDPGNPQLAAALAMVDRPRSELTPKASLSAGHWAGMPAYQDGGELPKITVRFETEADRAEFIARHGFRVWKKTASTWSMRWPETEDRDTASLRFAEVGRP